VFAAVQALQQAGEQALADRYAAWFTCMATNAQVWMNLGGGGGAEPGGCM